VSAPFVQVELTPEKRSARIEVDPVWLAEFILHLNRGVA
jgi:hypothetical protein